MKRVFVVEISIQATLMGLALLVTIIARSHGTVSTTWLVTGSAQTSRTLALGYRIDLVNVEAGPNKFTSVESTLNVGTSLLIESLELQIHRPHFCESE